MSGFELEPQVAPGCLHPGKAALVSWTGGTLGYLGELHPALAETWELREKVVVGELNLERVLGAVSAAVRFEGLPRFPAVARDLSILWDRKLEARTLADWIRAAAGPLLAEVAVSDRYDRPPVPEGKVSLTLSLRYQRADRTLTSEEVQGSVRDVVSALRSRGAESRGEELMENGFDLLEEKVKKTAELVRHLRGEKHGLQQELGRAKARLAEAEKKLAAQEKAQGATAEQVHEAQALARELKSFKEEREEIRATIGRLVELLDGLE
jgi:hypothetical protein